MISSVNVNKLQFPADLATFSEEIVNGKLHFLCSVSTSMNSGHLKEKNYQIKQQTEFLQRAIC